MYYFLALLVGLLISEYINSRGIVRPWHKPRHIEGVTNWTATNLALSGPVAVWTETPDGFCETVDLPRESIGTCTSWISVSPGQVYQLKSPWPGQCCDARVSLGPDNIAVIVYSLYQDGSSSQTMSKKAVGAPATTVAPPPGPQNGHNYALAWARPDGLKHLLFGPKSIAVLDHPGDYIRIVRGVPHKGQQAEIFVLKSPEGPMGVFYEPGPTRPPHQAEQSSTAGFSLVANFVPFGDRFIGLAKRRLRGPWAYLSNQGIPSFEFMSVVLDSKGVCLHLSRPFTITASAPHQAEFIMIMSMDIQKGRTERSDPMLRLGLGISDCYAGFARMPLKAFVDQVMKPEAYGHKLMLRPFPLDSKITD